MGNYNFVKDLKVAKKSELEVCEILESKYGMKIVEDQNKDNRYDIMVEKDNKQFSFEVKEDFMCGDTGNVAVEYESRGKPSGISVTESEFYVYKLHMKDGIKYLSLSTDKVRKLISNKEYFRVVNGGDKGSNTMMYLFKLPVFAKDAKQL